MAKEIYVIRHGETEYNRLGIWQGCGVDSPLNQTGWDQARKFYNKYQDKNFDLIVHSGLTRSKETVSPFAQIGIPFIEKDEINEISWGIYEGNPHTQKSIDDYYRIIGAWSRKEYKVGFQGGESAHDLASRVNRFIDWLDSYDAQRILVCSHGRTIRAMITLMKGEELTEMEKYKHHNTGLFIAQPNGMNYQFLLMNNIDHLQ